MGDNQKDKRATILIVDDHPAIRESLAAWINRQSDLRVCGEAADANDAFRLAVECRPDIAVVDISLRTGNGIDLIRRIRDRVKGVRALVWSSHSEAVYAERCLRAGAMGYVQKDQVMETLMEAIHRVLKGKVYVSNVMNDTLLVRNFGDGQSPGCPLQALADRELEVFRLIGEGVKTADIANRMHLSINTIQTYRERIKTKLNLTCGSQLTYFAMQWVLEKG